MNMLWYKSWLETRWRFVIGIVILICSATGMVLTYPMVVHRLSLASTAELATIDPGGPLGDQIREGLTLIREYRGYVWWEWFRQNLPQMWTLFAVLLGTGGLLAQSSGGAALFTLSLPASRTQHLGVRAATALAELLALAVVPALMIPLLSPAIGQSFGVGEALVHAICLFIGGTTFFSLAFLLSTVFADVWRPALIAIGVAMVLSLGEQLSRELGRYGIFAVMTAQSYFRTGELPWLGLVASVGLSSILLYAATVNLARRDF